MTLLQEIAATKVKDLISRPRWTKGYYYRTDPSNVGPDNGTKTDNSCHPHEATCGCLVGLIRIVYTDLGARWDVYMKLARKIDELNGDVPSDYGTKPNQSDPQGRLVLWNDHEDRTYEEVETLVNICDV